MKFWQLFKINKKLSTEKQMLEVRRNMLIDQYNKDKSLSFKAMSEIRKLNIKIEQLDQKGFENLRKDKNATDRQLMET